MYNQEHTSTQITSARIISNSEDITEIEENSPNKNLMPRMNSESDLTQVAEEVKNENYS